MDRISASICGRIYFSLFDGRTRKLTNTVCAMLHVLLHYLTHWFSLLQGNAHLNDNSSLI